MFYWPWRCLDSHWRPASRRLLRRPRPQVADQIEEAPAVPLVAADGKVLGEIAAGDSAESALLKLTAQGLPPGSHGAHIHDVGLCEGPSFESAGPHWDPENKEHGLQNPQGPHRGDLPNLMVADDGRAEVTMTVQGSNLAGSRAYGFSNKILDEMVLRSWSTPGPMTSRLIPAATAATASHARCLAPRLLLLNDQGTNNER